MAKPYFLLSLIFLNFSHLMCFSQVLSIIFLVISFLSFPTGNIIRSIFVRNSTQWISFFLSFVQHHPVYSSFLSPVSSEPSKPPTPDVKRKSPRGSFRDSSTPSFGSNISDLDKAQLEPSRLLDILTKKSSFPGSFISIPEIQARNKVLKHCGLPDEEEYLVLFTPNYKDAMMLVGESYPFFRGNFYMTIIGEESDYVREFASYKESKVISAPETWLDLRIKGSQLSQYFRRKCKHSPKGLFSYPADVNGTRYSVHWISEAHRNSWHVLLDATALVVGEDRLKLALHRPDFVLCSPDNTHAHPSKITCLLVRRKSFDTA